MIQNIPKEKILEALQEGPTLPIKISRKVGGDTMIVGAILSTLINSGDVAVSSLKVGGSPLYYLPGQEEKLESFINYLNDKDQKTFKMLKEKKILQDSAQDPLARVSLRTIKDFAKTFEIDFEGRKELFWRFYQYSKEEALEEAKKILLSQKPVQAQPKAEIEQESHKEKQKISEPKTVPEVRSEIRPEIKQAIVHKERRKHEKKMVEEAKPLEEKVIIGQQEPAGKDKKEFFEQVRDHIHKMNLDIISKERVKKSEYTFVLKNHDANEYIYCVAKDKKNVNEGDLSIAFVFSQAKKMPCLFLMTGKLNKKGESMKEKEFKEMKIEMI